MWIVNLTCPPQISIDIAGDISATPVEPAEAWFSKALDHSLPWPDSFHLPLLAAQIKGPWTI